MTIDFELDEASIDRAIRLVELYSKDLHGKSRVLVKKLANTVETNARNELSSHVWSGQTLASLHTDMDGSNAKANVSVGGAAVWLEFGTGVVANNCETGEFVHPKAQELGMYGIGEYGHGWGSNPKGWYFYPDAEWDEDQYGATFNVYQNSMHTFGIPATRFMYHSAWAARRNIVPFAKEVFWTR